MELKTKTGRLSIAQATFIRERLEDGYMCHIAYSSDEAIQLIKEFYDVL